MPTPFRRKSSAVIETTEPEPAAETPAPPKNYTPSKRELGVVTPKRGGANARNVGAPPLDKNEARAKNRRRTAAMRNDEDWALYDRDQGPEKRIARDVVDSRRNLAEYFLYFLIAFMAATLFTGGNLRATYAIEGILVVFVIAIAFDGWLLVKKVNQTVAERLPNLAGARLGRYAVMRAMSFRRGRVPKPQVERGQPIRAAK